MSLLSWLWKLFDRGTPIQYGPLDEDPPPVKNWGDAVSDVRKLERRPRRMDEPRWDNGDGLRWEDRDD